MIRFLLVGFLSEPFEKTFPPLHFFVGAFQIPTSGILMDLIHDPWGGGGGGIGGRGNSDYKWNGPKQNWNVRLNYSIPVWC